MRLTHASIENFRGIATLSLDLDDTTVVVGENNTGKTSLFDLLERCLGRFPDGGGPAWEYRDFRRGPEGVVGPIRVVLTFEPVDHGRRTLSDRLLASAARVGSDGLPRIRVEFTGRPGSGAMETHLLDAEDQPLSLPGGDAVIGRLRALHPVFVVRLNQPPPDDRLEWVSREDRESFDPGDGDSPEEVISQVYHRLTRTRGAVPTEEVLRGLQAARALRASMATGEVGAYRQVGRVLDRFLAEAAEPGPTPRGGGGSHNLGLLMVLGSLLEVPGRASLEAEARPIIAIEEPEVHLHPMLLSSTWDVIQGLQAQTLVTTNSGEFVAEVPLRQLRRLVRRNGRIEAYRLGESTLGPDALRRVGYHVRARRGGTLFARCWLLVEGETEFWLMGEMARVLGYDLQAEGVRCMEFAQCGVAPLVRLANDLGIQWHLLSDGDGSGVAFAEDAARQLGSRRKKDHVTRLKKRDMEMLLWHHGFSDVYLRAAGLLTSDQGDSPGRTPSPRRVVARAVRAHSKPFLALTVAEECARRGPEAVPPPLRKVIDTAVRLAREAADSAT